MKMEVQRHYIDSKDRVNGDLSDFEHPLSMHVTTPTGTIAVLDTVLIPVC